MHVIQVIPLLRGTHLESLSYFSALPYEVGTIVTVPIRGKNYQAVVIETKPVTTSKTNLKSASFSLRKLPEQKNPAVLPDSLKKTAERLATRYPASLGALLYHLLPPDIRSGATQYPHSTTLAHTEDSTPQVLAASIAERFIAYRSHIRSTLAHRGSTLFVVPTAPDVAHATSLLSQGIEERVVTFSPSQTKRARMQAYTAFEDNTIAKLIITTPSHAYLERPDLLSIIIEQSANPLYKARTRPYLDHRDALCAYAHVGGRSIIFGDTVPRTEDEYKRRQEFFTTHGQETKRIAFNAPLTIVTQKDKPTPEIPFSLFSKELATTITRTLEGRGHVFLFGARRGLSPVVVCIDCGYIFRCPDSHTPYSLLRTTKNGAEERWFVSSTSGKRIPAADVCEQCGSWRLRERGIGIQQVFDESKNQFPRASITLFDSTTASTPEKSKKLIEAFYDKKGGILVGTPMTLPYLHRGVDVSAVVSLDATRSTPTWRADEWVFQLLMRLRELSQKEVLVQTRLETDSLLLYASRGALERFYDDEITLRKMVGYPPFATFILLSWSGSSDVTLAVETEMKNVFASFKPQCYSNPHSTPQKTLRHALIRLPEGSIPGAFLTQLRNLPPYIKVEMNPDRII